MAMDSHQKELPFAEAEGSRAERKNMLGLAMLKVGVDAEESRLMEWVFNITDGGTRGTLRKTLTELRATPWGLCCSEDKARSAVARMKRRGLLVVDETWLGSGAQGPNAFRVDWDGIRDILCLPSVLPANYRAPNQSSPGSASDQGEGGWEPGGGVAPSHPRVAASQGGVAPSHPYNRNITLPNLFLAGRPEEVAVAEAKTADPPRSVETAPLGWTPENRSTVVAALRSVGYDHQVSSRLARESETVLGQSPDEVLAICEEFLHPANRQRFRRCGAVGYRIRNGSWPADGVVPLHAARKAASAHSDKTRSLESERVLREIVLAGRAAKLPEDEIRSRLRQSLPAEFCQANGW